MTVTTSDTGNATDAWSALDELWGTEIAAPVDDRIGDVAFYGRCSTEDNQGKYSVTP